MLGVSKDTTNLSTYRVTRRPSVGLTLLVYTGELRRKALVVYDDGGLFVSVRKSCNALHGGITRWPPREETIPRGPQRAILYETGIR